MNNLHLPTLFHVFLEDYKNESPATKKVVLAIPETNSDYRPDEKSKTAIDLAWHILYSDIWFLKGIAALEFDKNFEERPADVATGAALMAWYEAQVAEHLPKVKAMSEEQYATPVDFYGMFNFPAVFYLQFMINHHIHHRGQLSTYLRPMGGKCPSIYGGSADEPMGA